MKTKLDMAHEYMQNTLKLLRENNVPYDFKHLVEESFDYADTMQAEAEKREPSGLPDALKEEWQPDWNQAPDWANYWCMNYDNLCYWTESQPRKKWSGFAIVRNEKAPTFNYSGYWKDSLRKRPEVTK